MMGYGDLALPGLPARKRKLDVEVPAVQEAAF